MAECHLYLRTREKRFGRKSSQQLALGAHLTAVLSALRALTRLVLSQLQGRGTGAERLSNLPRSHRWNAELEQVTQLESGICVCLFVCLLVPGIELMTLHLPDKHLCH